MKIGHLGNSPLTSGQKPISNAAMTREDLLAEIDAFLANPKVKMTETTFGRLAVNDGKFVGRLRDGKGLTLETFEKVRAFIQRERETRAAA